jgi:hypothetical protein
VKVEKAKQADQAAVTYAKKKLLASNDYLNASDTKKAELVSKSYNDTLQKRYVSLS